MPYNHQGIFTTSLNSMKQLLFSLLLLISCNISARTLSIQDIPPRFAITPHGQIEYYKMGKGTPIILIPGYATDLTSWNREFLIALAKQHELIILNNRNVGRSFGYSTDYDSKVLANDVSDLCKALRLKKTNVLGISMGGMIAQQFAVLHPEQLYKLVLINTAIAGQKSVRPPADIANRLLNMPTNKFKRYQLSLELFFPPEWKTRMAFALIFERFQPQSYQEINLPVTLSPQQHLLMRWLADNATRSKLKKVTAPVLILNGQADIVIPPENSIILTKIFPHATLVRWKDGGHAMIYQFPLQMANVINHFLE